MIPDTATRVEQHTAAPLNERIRRETQERIDAFRSDDRYALITQRLEELDSEWDVERMLQTNFAVLSLVGLALATKVNKGWFALALGVPAFMIQHSLQGWCPPLAVLRRLGFRTSKEIAEERFALKSLRGDFKDISGSANPGALFNAVKS
jgi:hypothetical protein